MYLCSCFTCAPNTALLNSSKEPDRQYFIISFHTPLVEGGRGKMERRREREGREGGEGGG